MPAESHTRGALCTSINALFEGAYICEEREVIIRGIVFVACEVELPRWRDGGRVWVG